MEAFYGHRFKVKSGFSVLTRVFFVVAGFFISGAMVVHGQAIHWEQNYGGSDVDNPEAVSKTADGGYIIAGHTTSDDYDVSNLIGIEGDCWVVKTDFNGDIIWERTYGGGDGTDNARDIQQLPDGGYIMVAQSNSRNGDITSPVGEDGGVTDDDNDIWVVRLNSSGELLWEQSYGGTDEDVPLSVKHTKGHHIVAGYTASHDYDVSENHGSTDVWIIQLDDSGNIEWKQTYGGSGAEGLDKPSAFQITDDKGYVMAATSSSSDHDVSGNYGHNDVWVVKLDSAGSILWEKHYGGTKNDRGESIRQTKDGGYIVSGISSSDDYDVSDNYSDKKYDFPDYWVLKLDSVGNLEWEENYGSSSSEYNPVINLTENGYLIAGESGYVSHDVSHIYGYSNSETPATVSSDIWVVKVDSTGNIIWDENYGTGIFDNIMEMVSTSNGNHVIAGSVHADNYDVSGHYDSEDYWLLKIDESASKDETGIAQNDFGSSFKLYPNPTQGRLQVDMGQAYTDVQVVLTTTTGRQLKKLKFGAARRLDFRIEQPSGIYLLTIKTKSGQTARMRVVKR